MARLDRLADRLGMDPFAILGLIGIVVVTGFVALTYDGTIRKLFNGSDREVTAVFKDARTLRKGDPVRVRGVKVGLVQKLEPIGGGRGTKVWMSVADDAGTIHQDARAKVAYRTLLGGAFVVNIEPGTTAAGKLRGSIPMSQTSDQVELDQITTVVQGAARDGLRAIPRELEKTMSRPDVIANLGDAVSDNGADLERGLKALRGTDESRDLQLLAAKTAATVKALDAPDDGLHQVVAGAAATLQTTAARQGDLRTTFARSPAAMRETQATLADLDTTLDLADPVVKRLQGPAGRVAPALRALRPVLTGADRLLGNAEPLFQQLRPAVRSLAATARDGLPLLRELQPSFDRLDKTILPYMNEIDPQTAHSAAQMVGPALGGLGNVAAHKDDNGHWLRFPFSDGSSPFYLPCQVYYGNPDKTKLIECRALQDIVDSYVNWKPLSPAPGTAPAPGGTK